MKFLIFGASGMAGHQIALYLQERGHDVRGFTRRPFSLVPSVQGDVRDEACVREVVRSGHFDSVINCVGILNQFAEQDHCAAVYLNAYFPHLLAQLTEGTDTQVIHMSTDCVFSGRSGRYTETSLRDGETFYDRTKALGELEDGKNITLRCSIVGPDISADGIGLLNWFLRQTGEVNGYTRAMWTGVTTLQLARLMERAAAEKAHGLYHTVPAHNISKYELLRLFNRYLRNDALTVRPYDGFAADKTLVRTRFDFAPEIPDYEAMVREMADWIRAHKRLYPHYNL